MSIAQARLLGRNHIMRFVTMVALRISACQSCRAAPAPPAPSVAVVDVGQQDVPVQMEWIATLDGYVNAQIQAQVTGYLVSQKYTEGSPVKKGDVLFEIDPRPLVASLENSRGQLAQVEAQLGRAQRGVERDRPRAVT